MFKPQPLPAHVISHHPAHLTSLAEDSEEGSDAVSESEGGLIQDDDLPTLSPAASASLDHSQGSKVMRSSVAATGQAAHKEHAAAGTDGMFELDIHDNVEQVSGSNSFTAKGRQRLSQHAAFSNAGMQSDLGSPGAVMKGEGQVAGQTSGHNAAAAAAAASPVSDHSAAVAIASDDVLQPNSSSTAGQSDQSAQPSQHPKLFVQPSLPNPADPAAVLSPVPILGQAASFAAPPVGSQPMAAAADTLAGVDLEEVELEDAVAGVPSDRAVAEQAATDEWEEVNLARAKELAVDAPTAAIPGDKVAPETLVAAHAQCDLLHFRLAGLPFWSSTNSANTLHVVVLTLIEYPCIFT